MSGVYDLKQKKSTTINAIETNTEKVDNNLFSLIQKAEDEKNALQETMRLKKEQEEVQFFQNAYGKEFTIFTPKIHAEKNEVPAQIARLKELISEIQQQTRIIKAQSAETIAEVTQVEKETIKSLPEKPSIYHIRFLETIIQLLRGLRERIHEANTWIKFATIRKAKRGSAFLILSKKKGSQYSLSSEHAITRSVQ